MTAPLSNKKFIESLDERNPSVNWRARLGAHTRRFLGVLESISLNLEKPLNWIINDARFNRLQRLIHPPVQLDFVVELLERRSNPLLAFDVNIWNL